MNRFETGEENGSKYIFANLAYVKGGLAESGPLAGDGYFLAVHLDCDDVEWDAYDDVEVAVLPSQGTGYVSIKNDPDRVVVCKLDESVSQTFNIRVTKGGNVQEQTIDINP